MSSFRILVADDHSITRRGVRALLESDPAVSVCGEAATGAEVILKAKRLKPDLIVMDILMPEVNGLEATRQIHQEMPEVPVLILSMHESDQLVREVLDAGARGYVLKSDIDQTLLMAVRALRKGKPFLSARTSEMLVEGFLKGTEKRLQEGKRPATELTERQKQVVRLLAEGKTNKEVAAALGISVKTAETHRTQIMAKLELKSFSDLVRFAVRENLVPL